MIYSIIDMEGKTVYYYLLLQSERFDKLEPTNSLNLKVDDNTDNRINRFIQEYINKNIINILLKSSYCSNTKMTLRIGKPNTRISKYKILILEHLIPWLIRKVIVRFMITNSSHYSKISFSAMNY
ncbi:hypothetical protein H8356DRAFT_1334006, partial [Neocallimastix lanati (nom. inval.)]